MTTALGQWLVRLRAYGISARFQVISAFLVGVVKSGGGFIRAGAATLIVTNVVGTAFAMLLMLWAGMRHWRTSPATSRAGRPASLLRLLKEYRDFPIYRMPQHFMNTVSQSIPVIMLAASFGPGAAGKYSIAISVLAMPATLIGNSVVSVLYPRLTDAVRNGEDVRRIVVKSTAGLALIGCAPYLLVMAIGPWLFQLVFGAEWRESGQYAQWLAPWLFFQFIHRPAVAAIPALGLNKSLLIYEVMSSGAKILALMLGGIVLRNVTYAIAMFSFVGVVSYVGLIAWLLKNSPTGRSVPEMDRQTENENYRGEQR